MRDVSELVARLRACANGMGTFKTNTGDFGLCDDAADGLSALIAENEALKEANENLGILSDEDVAMYQEAIARAEAAEAKVGRLVAALQDADQAVMESTTDHEWLAGGERISADLRTALREIGGGNG